MHSPFRESDNVVNNGSAVRVVRLRASKEAVIDPLGDDDIGELNVSHARVLEGLFDGLDLSLVHVRDLPVAHSIPDFR